MQNEKDVPCVKSRGGEHMIQNSHLQGTMIMSESVCSLGNLVSLWEYESTRKIIFLHLVFVFYHVKSSLFI